jgi:CRP-like cAMP-binding protein
MAKNNASDPGTRRLGEYLGCGPDVIRRALERQRVLRNSGVKKRLGELLLEEQAISSDDLSAATLHQRLDRLSSCPIFSDLSKEDLMQIRDLVSEESVDNGQLMIDQDEPGRSFFILVQGRALVLRMDEDGNEVHLAYIESGECVGEMGYFARGRRSASVRALEDCLLLEIAYDDLVRVFQIAPKLSAHFLNLVTERLRRMNLRFEEMVMISRGE